MQIQLFAKSHLTNLATLLLYNLKIQDSILTVQWVGSAASDWNVSNCVVNDVINFV